MIILILIITLQSLRSFADEGMWTVNNFPTKIVQAKYNFSANSEWLNHIQMSSALLNGGCSAGFISKNGLLLTNHHCLFSCLETVKNDIFTNGFYAKKLTDELKCPGFEVGKLLAIKDVTKNVRELTKNAKNLSVAKKIAISKIEKDCAPDANAVRCKIISFGNGSKYDLYQYKLYRDVRLVFAPEHSVANFGGYIDNFDFPRSGFDVSFLRVYENDQPLVTQDFFNWSANGAQEGEVIFVAGNPGPTSRHLSVAELEFERDSTLPAGMIDKAELRGVLTGYQSRGPDEKRTSAAKLYGVENDLKALKSSLTALHESNFISRRASDEKALHTKLKSNTKLQKQFNDGLNEIESSYQVIKTASRELNAIENIFLSSPLLRAIRDLLYDETDARLIAEAQQLINVSLASEEFDIFMMTYYLKRFREILGPDHSSVKRILGEKSPANLADDLVRSTALRAPGALTKLANERKEAIEKSTDPMILFAKTIDSEANFLWKKSEESRMAFKEAKQKVTNAYLKIDGPDSFPETNFTLRVSFGSIKGIQKINNFKGAFTYIQSAFDRHTGSEPSALPKSWLTARSKLNLETPLNFTSDNDIVGGNSGSPVLNRKSEVVGVVFDANKYSAAGIYGYDRNLSRSVAVHSAGVTEILKNVYGADRILNEITNK